VRREPLVCRFRVYPERGRPEYFVVFVFADKAAMFIFFREQNKRQGARGATAHCDFLAITRPWTRMIVSRRGRTRTHPEMGHLLFALPNLGASVVSHEMTHAVIRWAERVMRKPARIFDGVMTDRPSRTASGGANERFCRAQGRMVYVFWANYYRVRPHDEPRRRR
jgi:hypothetical protein